MVVDVTFLALTLLGPIAMTLFGAVGGGPKLGILGGLTTTVYIGVHSNSEFYGLLAMVIGGLITMIVGLRFARLVIE